MKLFHLVLLCSLPFFCLAQSAEKYNIRFFEGSWEEALAEAQKTGKLIFVDAYTTWCGPCKRMEKEVFTQKKVANYYNSKFINVRLDMERGEGVAFARKYLVRVFPNLLYIDGKGDVMHRRAGFLKAKDFIGLGSLAQNPQYRLAGMWQLYEEGERSPDFLTALTKTAFAAKDNSHKKVVNEYLNVNKDWGTDLQRMFIIDYLDDTNTPAYDYLLSHKDEFIEQFGDSRTNTEIRKIIYNSVRDTKTESSIEQVHREFNRAYPDGSGQKYALNFERNFYKKVKEYRKFAEASIKYHEQAEQNPFDLNNTAWYFYEFFDDQELLQIALEWINQSIDIDTKYYNLDTKAHLLFKLGDRKKADEFAQMAIELGQKEGTDISDTQRLLQKIRE